jgi:hypothetical protein
MKTRRTAAVAALAAAAMLATFVPLSGAAGDPGPRYPADACEDPNVDCGYDDFATGTTTESPPAYENSAGPCRTRWANAIRRNLFWQVVFKYNEQVRWCWRDNKITYFWRDRWASDTHWGWAFDGHIGSNCIYEHCPNRGTGSYSTDAWTQGRFHVCLKFCLYKYPIVGIWVHGDGGSGAWWGGA